MKSERGQAGPGGRRRDAAGPEAGEGSAARAGHRRAAGRAGGQRPLSAPGQVGRRPPARPWVAAGGGLGGECPCVCVPRPPLPPTPHPPTPAAGGPGAAERRRGRAGPRAPGLFFSLFWSFLPPPLTTPPPLAGQLLAACAGAIPGQRCLYSCPWVEGERQPAGPPPGPRRPLPSLPAPGVILVGVGEAGGGEPAVRRGRPPRPAGLPAAGGIGLEVVVVVGGVGGLPLRLSAGACPRAGAVGGCRGQRAYLPLG